MTLGNLHAVFAPSANTTCTLKKLNEQLREHLIEVQNIPASFDVLLDDEKLFENECLSLIKVNLENDIAEMLEYWDVKVENICACKWTVDKQYKYYSREPVRDNKLVVYYNLTGTDLKALYRCKDMMNPTDEYLCHQHALVLNERTDVVFLKDGLLKDTGFLLEIRITVNPSKGQPLNGSVVRLSDYTEATM